MLNPTVITKKKQNARQVVAQAPVFKSVLTVDGTHTSHAHSRMGLFIVFWAVDLVTTLALCKQRRKHQSFESAFFIMLTTWMLYSRTLFNVAANYILLWHPILSSYRDIVFKYSCIPVSFSSGLFSKSRASAQTHVNID